MVLKISLDEVNKSLKFSAFIAFGILFAISLVQIILTDSLFWQIIGVISGVIFIFLLSLVLIKVLKPLFAAMKERKKARKKLKKRSVWDVIKSWFKASLYLKIMAMIWVVILLVALDFTAYNLGLLDKPEKIEVLANFGFMVITVSTAFIVFYVSRLFRKK